MITEEHKLLNINFPQHPTGDIDWTSQSVRQYDGRILANENPMGKEHFWFTVVPIEPEERDSDRWAVKHGKTSITPMVLNLTDQNYLNKKHVKNS